MQWMHFTGPAVKKSLNVIHAPMLVLGAITWWIYVRDGDRSHHCVCWGHVCCHAAPDAGEMGPQALQLSECRAPPMK